MILGKKFTESALQESKFSCNIKENEPGKDVFPFYDYG